MPPLPRSKATRSGSGTQSPRTAREPGGSTRESSSTPSPGAPPRRGRVTKSESLEVKVARMYNMLGTMLSPMGRFYPVMGPLGENLKSLSDEAAEAWIELAEQDKRVKEMLESMTGASLWGNVIGVHFAIFSVVIPGGEVIAPVMTGQSEEEIVASLFQQMSPQEQEAARQFAAQFSSQEDVPTRERSTGGPGDTVQAAPAPTFDPTQTFGPSAAPPPMQSSAAPGIVTAEQLGVQNGGEQGIFPNDPSGPNGRAAQ